nr:MAG: hypothetical protein [Enquatrovirus sp.]
MIKLNPYNLDSVPDYCLYARTCSPVCKEPKFGIIYLNSNTKFGYWFKKYYIPLAKYAKRIETKSMLTLCCRNVTAYAFYVQLKQLRKVQGLKEGKDFKKFIQWINKEALVGNKLIWFTTYKYLEQLYEGTL